MDSNFIIIGFFQFVVMLIYRWVNIEPLAKLKVSKSPTKLLAHSGAIF
jgi:hypothetical protein